MGKSGGASVFHSGDQAKTICQVALETPVQGQRE